MPRLTLVETGSARSHRVDGTEVLVGRDPSCGIFLEGEEAKTVSGRHARFFFDNEKWYVEDAGSRNGTYIGRQKLEPGTCHALTVGEVIGLGLTGTQLTVRELGGRLVAATMLEAAPAPVPPPASTGALRVVLRSSSGAHLTGQGDLITIGRSLECVIRIEGESATSVSRVHAEIRATNGQATLRDGGSRHGTFLNGQKLETPAALEIGDVLSLGPGGPTLTVEELGPVPGGVARPAVGASPAAGEPTAGPSSVRAPAQKRPSPARPNGDSENEANRPTPPTDNPVIRKSATPRRSPATPARQAERSTAVMIGGAVFLAVAIAAGVFITRNRTSARRTDDVRQQAEELEVSRSEALADAATAKATLDSATNAAAPEPLLDSLRQISGAADKRSAQLGDSLERIRARLTTGR